MNRMVCNRRFVARCILGLFAIGWLCAGPAFAGPQDKAAIESVLRSAPQKGGPEREVALAWANSLDPLARGLAQVLKDPEALALLKARMAASPLSENTVILKDLLDAKAGNRRFGALLAKAAGTTEKELHVALAALPAPLTLFFPRKEDRAAVLGRGKARPDIQVTWDAFWIPQENLSTLLAYDTFGNQMSYSVKEPPAGPVLVLSTENSQAPVPPPAAAPVAQAAAAGTTALTQTCSYPYLELVGLYLVTDHEGWPRGNPEADLFLADWNSSMPGNELVIRPTTPYIFSGRYVTDAAGRSRYLPDVNDTGRWYTFPGIAVFQYNPYLGSGLYLVEDDDQAGVLALGGNYSIGFTCSVYPGCTGTQCSGCQPTGSGIINLAKALIGSGDDKFSVPFRSVGGAPFGTILEADMKEWRLRYQVACPY
jgi:hypothetical protein